MTDEPKELTVALYNERLSQANQNSLLAAMKDFHKQYLKGMPPKWLPIWVRDFLNQGYEVEVTQECVKWREIGTTGWQSARYVKK